MERPDIFGFVDYRAFLDDWFAWKKRVKPRYSHRALARAVGERSPGFLGDVIRGRRNLTAVRRDALAKVIGLDDEESRFFRLLVDLDQAPDMASRKRIWDAIAGTRRFRSARRLDGDSYAYLARWYYPAIRELAAVEGFVADAAWVAARIRPEIKVEEAQEALDALFALGMLIRTEDGTVQQAEGSIATPRQVVGLAVHEYHRGMLERARDGVSAFPSAERHLVGVTVCIPESLVPRLKEEVDDFAARLLDLCDDASERGERVYQINLNLIPLSAGSD